MDVGVGEKRRRRIRNEHIGSDSYVAVDEIRRKGRRTMKRRMRIKGEALARRVNSVVFSSKRPVLLC